MWCLVRENAPGKTDCRGQDNLHNCKFYTYIRILASIPYCIRNCDFWAANRKGEALHYVVRNIL